MKKILCLLILFSIAFCSFAKELEGKDLDSIIKAKDATLYAYNFDDMQEQNSFLDDVMNEIEADRESISEEALFLCSKIIEDEKFKIADNILKKQEKELNSKEIKKQREKKSLEFYSKQVLEYKDFESTHSDLSTIFYFHYKGTEMETSDSLSFGKQMKMLKNLFKTYEEIEKKNPGYVENLYTYGSLLYMLPGLFGGNQQKGFQKIQKALESAETTYDKVNSIIFLSQVCFEAGLKDEWQSCMEALDNLVPGNSQILEVKELNESGKSLFEDL